MSINIDKTFLEITDLPQDNLQVFNKLRKPLIAAFNKSRDYPEKLASLKGLIKFFHTQIVSFESVQKELLADKVAATEALCAAEAELSTQLAPKVAENAVLVGNTPIAPFVETEEPKQVEVVLATNTVVTKPVDTNTVPTNPTTKQTTETTKVK